MKTEIENWHVNLRKCEERKKKLDDKLIKKANKIEIKKFRNKSE